MPFQHPVHLHTNIISLEQASQPWRDSEYFSSLFSLLMTLKDIQSLQATTSLPARCLGEKLDSYSLLHDIMQRLLHLGANSFFHVYLGLKCLPVSLYQQYSLNLMDEPIPYVASPSPTPPPTAQSSYPSSQSLFVEQLASAALTIL